MVIVSDTTALSSLFLIKNLNQLRTEGGFWISEKLYQRVLQEVGE